MPYLTYTTSVPAPTPTVTQYLPATTVSVTHVVTEAITHTVTHAVTHTVTQAVTQTVTVTLPPPPPPVCTVIVPWEPFHVNRDVNNNLQPHRIDRDIPAGGAWLVVTDADRKNAKYRVTVDGHFLGETSGSLSDPSAYCNPNDRSGDDCVRVRS